MTSKPDAASSGDLHIMDLVSPGACIANITGTTKFDVLQQMAQHVAHLCPCASAKRIFDILWEREELGSTGIEAGIAIPHGRLQDISRPILAVGKSTIPVEFDAIDELPSDLFFVVIAPTTSNDHLKVLSRLAQLFKLTEFPEHLRYCQSPEEMHRCLMNWEAALPC